MSAKVDSMKLEFNGKIDIDSYPKNVLTNYANTNLAIMYLFLLFSGKIGTKFNSPSASYIYIYIYIYISYSQRERGDTSSIFKQSLTSLKS